MGHFVLVRASDDPATAAEPNGGQPHRSGAGAGKVGGAVARDYGWSPNTPLALVHKTHPSTCAFARPRCHSGDNLRWGWWPTDADSPAP